MMHFLFHDHWLAFGFRSLEHECIFFSWYNKIHFFMFRNKAIRPKMLHKTLLKCMSLKKHMGEQSVPIMAQLTPYISHQLVSDQDLDIKRKFESIFSKKDENELKGDRWRQSKPDFLDRVWRVLTEWCGLFEQQRNPMLPKFSFLVVVGGQHPGPLSCWAGQSVSQVSNWTTNNGRRVGGSRKKMMVAAVWSCKLQFPVCGTNIFRFIATAIYFFINRWDYAMCWLKSSSCQHNDGCMIWFCFTRTLIVNQISIQM